MTRKEAIKFLGQYINNDCYTEKCQEAHRMSITALRGPSRELVEKIRREVKQIDKYLYACSKCDAFVEKNDDFCHRCGTPLTDEAVDKMFERWKEIFDENA